MTEIVIGLAIIAQAVIISRLSNRLDFVQAENNKLREQITDLAHNQLLITSAIEKTENLAHYRLSRLEGKV